MKNLSREAIKRMTGAQGSTTTIGGSGGGDMAGYATQLWTDENYVGKEFFRSLFKAYDANGNEVLPNDTNTQIDNIKAMFGFWTDFYISALGTGGQSTVGLRLAQLADVNVAGVTNGQVLTYDTTTGKWIASTPQSGTDMATVWSNLAANGNQQINYSHLSGAISLSNGTITIGSSTITPVTSSDITDMATKTWVGNNYLKLSGGSLTGSLTVGNDLTVNGGDFWLQEEGGQPRMVFHIPNQNWANITMKSNGEFYLYKTNVETNGLAGLNLGGLYAQDTVFAYKTNDAAGTYWNSPALCVGGNYDAAHIEIDSNEIMAKSNASTTTTLYLNAEGGTVCINETAGNCGIGTGSPSYKLHVNGTIGTGNLYAAGYVTALSDERKKDVVGEVNLTVEQIAKARTVIFTWKDKRDNELHMGCIAQDWQVLTPQLVHDRNDELSMEYSVIAAIGTIKNSQRLVNHETRLRRLEKMFALNDNDLED